MRYRILGYVIQLNPFGRIVCAEPHWLPYVYRMYPGSICDIRAQTTAALSVVTLLSIWDR